MWELLGYVLCCCCDSEHCCSGEVAPTNRVVIPMHGAVLMCVDHISFSSSALIAHPVSSKLSWDTVVKTSAGPVGSFKPCTMGRSVQKTKTQTKSPCKAQCIAVGAST